MDTLDRYVGKYSIGSVRILTITRDGDQLNAQISGQPKLPSILKCHRSSAGGR